MRKKLVVAPGQSYSCEETHRSRCDSISAAKRESCIAGVSDLLPFLFCILVYCAGSGHAARVPVQHKEGLIHGFLTLRNQAGEIISNGDLIQNAHGDRVTSRLIFHFKDGSIHDEANYRERG